MSSKQTLQNTLKEKYSINKNITQPLSAEDCQQLLVLLQNQPSAARLVESFIAKNSTLSQNNRYYGQRRRQAENRVEALNAEYRQLEKTIADLEKGKNVLGDRKQQLNEEQARLEQEVNRLASQNDTLASKVQTLTTENDELVEANIQLKKDNKDLKNIVDQIRLRLARDTKMLLQYEDSEIRRAMIRLFRWTLG